MKKMLPIIGNFFIIFILWSGYRLIFTQPVWFDEFIAKPLLWVAPLFYILKINSRERLAEFGLKKNQNRRALLLGMMTGIGMSLVRIGAVYLRLGYLVFTPYDLLPRPLFGHVEISLVTAVTEELVFRGYFLRVAVRELGNEWLANIFTTILFMLIHVPLVVITLGYNVSDALLYLVIIGLVSLVSGQLLFQQKNLAASVAFHATWNLFASIIR